MCYKVHHTKKIFSHWCTKNNKWLVRHRTRPKDWRGQDFLVRPSCHARAACPWLDQGAGIHLLCCIGIR